MLNMFIEKLKDPEMSASQRHENMSKKPERLISLTEHTLVPNGTVPDVWMIL